MRPRVYIGERTHVKERQNAREEHQLYLLKKRERTQACESSSAEDGAVGGGCRKKQRSMIKAS